MAEGIHEVLVEVIEVRGSCAAGYRPSDSFVIKGLLIDPVALSQRRELG